MESKLHKYRDSIARVKKIAQQTNMRINRHSSQITTAHHPPTNL